MAILEGPIWISRRWCQPQIKDKASNFNRRDGILSLYSFEIHVFSIVWLNIKIEVPWKRNNTS
jgi:hypothetical protein